VKFRIERDPAAAGRNAIRFAGWLSCAAAALVFAGTASAASGTLPQAQTRYQQERAVCISGQSNQDRTTCLQEAGAALQEAKRGHLDDDQSAYAQNRLTRCDRHAGDDREDCLRRMRGEGTVSGSVEGGGIYRELRRTVPAQ
jgi:hypothetical protein